jgi:hypothetical protein
MQPAELSVYAKAVGDAAASARLLDDSAADGGTRATKKDVFWMRDPKTGCWIPENRFQDDVHDAVELRNRMLHYR